MKNHVTYLDQAKYILQENHLGKFTKPAPSLYPYQWNWDSGFIAMGYVHYDLDKAILELQSLFSGQWSNGMLPQIIFHTDSDSYFPGPDFWLTEQAEHANENIRSSGITMPPVHGMVLRYMWDASDDPEVRSFIDKYWQKVLNLHSYLYNYRDPYSEGLPYIIHPWSSGTDNSPIFDGVFSQVDLSKVSIPDYKRKDLQSEEAVNHRPKKKDYDFYVYLVDLFRRKKYDDQAIFKETPFAIQDPLFLGILSRSNKDLIYLGELLGKNTNELEKWDALTTKSMNEKLWCDRGIYNAYNLKTEQIIEVYSHSGFIPMLGEIPDMEKAKFMRAYLFSDSFCGDSKFYACPSHAINRPEFEPQRYWRGPIWVNLNYLIIHGLYKYGYLNEAIIIKRDTLKLIEEVGFFEYFDPRKTEISNGSGTDNFSWTAALYIALTQESDKIN